MNDLTLRAFAQLPRQVTQFHTSCVEGTTSFRSHRTSPERRSWPQVELRTMRTRKHRCWSRRICSAPGESTCTWVLSRSQSQSRDPSSNRHSCCVCEKTPIVWQVQRTRNQPVCWVSREGWETPDWRRGRGWGRRLGCHVVLSTPRRRACRLSWNRESLFGTRFA